MVQPSRIPFFLDHCVPDSVGRVLKEAGHEVILLREWIAQDSPDQLVARMSEANGAVLVSIDSDYKQIAPRIPVGARQRFRKLSRIALCCNEPQAANRIKIALTLIEHEWAIAQDSSDQRMHITIQNSGIKTHR